MWLLVFAGERGGKGTGWHGENLTLGSGAEQGEVRTGAGRGLSGQDIDVFFPQVDSSM